MKKLLIITAALMLLSTQLYAGNGDLIVGGDIQHSGGLIGASTKEYEFVINWNASDGRRDLFEFAYDSANWMFNGIEVEVYKTYYNRADKTHFFVTRGYPNTLSYQVLYGGDTVGYWHSESVVSGNIKKAVFAINTPAYYIYSVKIRVPSQISVVASITGGQQIALLNTFNTTQLTTTNTGYTYFNGGNVGIGTTTPGTKFDVLAGSASSWMAQFQGNSPNGGYFTIHDAHNSATRGFVGYGGTLFSSNQISDFGLRSQGNLAFATNGGYTRMYIDTSGNVGIGTTDPGGYKLYVNGPTYTPAGIWSGSDVTFKRNIHPIDESLNKLLSLNGVSYEWKTDKYKDKGFPEGRHYGVIAQEIEKVLPEVVNTAPDGTKSVAYTEIIPVLIEAMKAQQKEINDLKALVGQLSEK